MATAKLTVPILLEWKDIEAYMAQHDIVEVVRCKDCKWGKETCGNIECFADRNAPTEYHGYDWYCPNGERREKED